MTVTKPVSITQIPVGVAAGMLAAAAAMPTAHASGGFQLEPLHPNWHHNKSWAAQYDHRAMRRYVNSLYVMGCWIQQNDEGS